MKKLTLILFIVIANNARTQTTIIDSILHDGIYRNFRIYVPAIYNGTQAVPLVLNLHGYTSNAAQQEWYGNFKPIADTANFIIVHPNGTDGGSGQFWNAYSAGSPDDIGFLSALIDTLDLNYNIDNDRVYTCGMSNGGIMSYYLSCNLNSKITAMGSVTGSMTHAMKFACVPATPVPVIEIHGTADGTVPYVGNGTFAHIDSVISYWVQTNNCTTTPVITNYPDAVTTDGCTATEYAYLNGDMGSEVVLVKINSGGHTWPGAPVTIGVTNRDFNASVRLWNFFRRYKKSQFNSIPEISPDLIFHVYPNPSKNDFTISLNSVETVNIFNSSGKCIHTFCGEAISKINTESWPSGIYLIQVGTKGTKLIVQH